MALLLPISGRGLIGYMPEVKNEGLVPESGNMCLRDRWQRLCAQGLTLVVCAGALFVPAQAQVSLKPLAKDDVITLLKRDVSPNRVGELAREHGIDFDVTPETELELREVCPTELPQACAELMTRLREIARPPAATVSTAPPITPNVPSVLGTAVKAGGTKVGAINIEQAILTSNEGRRAFDELAKRFELNQKSLRHTTEDAQKDLQNQQGEIGNRILTKMAPVMRKFVTDNGYGLILDTSQPWPKGPIVLVGSEEDITKAVVAAYDGTPAEPISAAQMLDHVPAAVNAGDIKVGTINIEQLIFASNEGRRAFNELARKFEPRQVELKGLADEIDSLKKQLNAHQDKLNGRSRDELLKQIERKQKSFDRATQDAQKDVQNQQGEIGTRILAKMAPVIKRYFTNSGAGLLFDTSQPWPQGSIIWSGPEVDITKAVVAAYDGSPAEPASGAGNSTAGVGKIAVINLVQAITRSREGQRTLQGVQDENDRGKAAQAILEKMAPSLIKFVRDQGIGVLIDSSKPWPQGPVMLAGEKSDLTQSFLDFYGH